MNASHRVAYLDTHVAVWLHQRALRKVSKEARRAIEAFDLLLSPAAYIELEVIRRARRVREPADEILDNLHTALGVTLCNLPFSTIAKQAVEIGWTRDPFDAMIVANARTNGEAPLITADGLILENYPRAVW